MSKSPKVVNDFRHLDDATKTSAIAARIRQHAGNPKFASVTFVKKDGTLRVLNMQRAVEAKNIIGTERGQKASATFAANHPNKFRVWDEKAQGFRQVDAEKVVSTRINGVEEIWRTLRAV